MSHIVACPHCSTQIRVPDWNTHQTLLCPRCLADVDNVRSTSQIQAPQLNTDVKRDLTAGSIVLAVLMGLCVLGIGLAILNRAMSLDTQLQLLFYSCTGLLVLVGIAATRGMIRRGSFGVLGCVLLVLGTVVAGVIFFCFACMIAFSRVQWGR